MDKEFDEYGVSGIMYRSNGSAGAFIKLAKVLNIPWLLLGDNDDGGKKSKQEVINCGYSKEDIAERLLLTSTKDIEHELAKSEKIFHDYELLVKKEVLRKAKQLKMELNDDKYKKAVISEIQKGKVENAYKLIEIWNQEERGFSKDEIPEVIKTLIEKV